MHYEFRGEQFQDGSWTGYIGNGNDKREFVTDSATVLLAQIMEAYDAMTGRVKEEPLAPLPEPPPAPEPVRAAPRPARAAAPPLSPPRRSVERTVREGKG